MYFILIKKSTGEKLYFRDEESRDDYIMMHEDEEFEDDGFCFDLPYFAEVIDNDEQRRNMETMLKFAGVDASKLSINEIYGTESDDHKYEDTEKRIEEYRDKVNNVYNYSKGGLEKTDENYKEVRIRQNIMENNQFIRAFFKELKDEEKELVKSTFEEYNLDFDKLEEYLDEELNIDLDPFLKRYEVERDELIAIREYKKTDAYKKHVNFENAIKASMNKIYNLDMQHDKDVDLPKDIFNINDSKKEQGSW